VLPLGRISWLNLVGSACAGRNQVHTHIQKTKQPYPSQHSINHLQMSPAQDWLERVVSGVMQLEPLSGCTLCEALRCRRHWTCSKADVPTWALGVSVEMH
jgi:hypothetical protein